MYGPAHKSAHLLICLSMYLSVCQLFNQWPMDGLVSTYVKSQKVSDGKVWSQLKSSSYLHINVQRSEIIFHYLSNPIVTYQSTLYLFILKSRDRMQTRAERLSYSYNTLIISNHNSKKTNFKNFNTRRTLEKGTKNPDYIRQTQHDSTPSKVSSRTCIHQTQQKD